MMILKVVISQFINLDDFEDDDNEDDDDEEDYDESDGDEEEDPKNAKKQRN